MIHSLISRIGWKSRPARFLAQSAQCGERLLNLEQNQEGEVL